MKRKQRMGKRSKSNFPIIQIRLMPEQQKKEKKEKKRKKNNFNLRNMEMIIEQTN